MADQLIQTQILGVFERIVNTKNGPRPIYEVQTASPDGSTPVYTTFIKELADEARAAIFQNVTLSVRISQNGNFINRYLQKIVATAPGAAPVTSHSDGLFPPVEQPRQNVVAPTPNVAAPAQDLTPQQANDLEAKREQQRKEKDASIHRQTACKVAAMLNQPGDSQLDFWQNVDYLIQFFDTGVKPLAVAIALDERAAA